MILAGRFMVAASLALPTCISFAAAAPRPSFRDRAATVISAIRPVGRLACESHGTGFAVGAGLVLTAAHVLLDRADVVQGCKLPRWALDRFRSRSGDPFALRVALRGRPAVAASLVATGLRGLSAQGMSFAASGDFAILQAASVASGEELHACDGVPAPNRVVLVVLPTGLVKTKVAATQSGKSGEDAGYIDLDRVFEQGTSGAGVIDVETSCVWGVISHRFPEPEPHVTRMTPVGAFAAAWKRARND